MRKVLVDADNNVVNVIEWSEGSDYTPPEGLTLVDDGDGAAIGGTYNPAAKTFTPPAVVDPDPTVAPPTGEEFAALQQQVAAIQAVAIPAWASGVNYAVGKVVSYEGTLYKCIQAHTSQANWMPPAVPALWTPVVQ